MAARVVATRGTISSSSISSRRRIHSSPVAFILSSSNGWKQRREASLVPLAVSTLSTRAGLATSCGALSPHSASAMATMSAIRVRAFGGTDVLQVEHSLPIPEPAADQILIRVEAAGVNPVEVRCEIGRAHV